MTMRPVLFAHRGGASYPPNVGIENTLGAFANAAALGITWMETDVHASADGVVFAAHDPDLHRVADRREPVGGLRADVLDDIRIGGREPLPRLESLFQALPDASFNIDMKSDAVVAPLIRLLRRLGHSRVRLASFETRRLVRARRALPGVRTSASTAEVARLLAARPLGGGPIARSGSLAWPGIDSVQIPLEWRSMRLVTRGAVDYFHRLGFEVHVWTVNDADTMRELIRIDADGIVTDRPDIGMRVLRESR